MLFPTRFNVATVILLVLPTLTISQFQLRKVHKISEFEHYKSFIGPNWKANSKYFNSTLQFNFHTLYKQAEKSRPFPPLENMDNIVSTWHKCRCFVTLDNFEFVDFQVISHPILLRSPVPTVAMYYNKVMRKLTARIVWLPRDTLSSNQTEFGITHERVFERSKFFMSKEERSYYDPKREISISLQPFRFSSSTKPWSCVVSLLVNPPPYVILGTKEEEAYLKTIYPEVFFYDIQFSNFRRIGFPSLNPSLTLLILNDAFVSHNFLNKFVTRELASSQQNLHGIRLTHRVLGYMTTFTSVSSSSMLLKFGRISFDVKLLIDCHVNKNCLRFKNTRLPILGNLSKVEKLVFSDEISNEGIYLKVITDGMLSYDGGFLSDCANYLTHNGGRASDLQIVFENPLDQLTEAYAHLWHNVFINFSHGGQGWICRDGRILDRPWTWSDKDTIPTISPATYSTIDLKRFPYPIHVPRKLSTLRFVSCGESKFKPITPEEMYNVFNPSVWLLISTSLTIVSTAVHLLGTKLRNSNFLEQLISPLKALLEQGDPFKSSSCKLLRLRLLTGPFLLVGIVLSNAYKHKNVYNMIAPRMPLPYDVFDDLVRDKFKIFTRFKIEYDSRELTDGSVWKLHYGLDLKAQPIMINVGQHDFYDVLDIFSEIEDIVVKVGIDLDASEDTLASEDLILTKALKWLQKSTTLYYDSLQELYDNVKNLSLKINSTLPPMETDVTDNLIQFGGSAEDNQKEKLYQRIKKCDNIAEVLPEFMAGAFQKRLKKEGKVNAHVGENVLAHGLLNMSDVIKLKGNFPPSVLKRFSLTKAAGLWNWWLELIRTFTLRKNAWKPNISLDAPTMSGNILLIFTILFYGLPIGFLLFLYEIKRKIYSMFKKLLQYLKTYASMRVMQKLKFVRTRNSDGNENRVRLTFKKR